VRQPAACRHSPPKGLRHRSRMRPSDDTGLRQPLPVESVCRLPPFALRRAWLRAGSSGQHDPAETMALVEITPGNQRDSCLSSAFQTAPITFPPPPFSCRSAHQHCRQAAQCGERGRAHFPRNSSIVAHILPHRSRRLKRIPLALAPFVKSPGKSGDVIERLDFLAAREEQTGTCAIRVSRHSGKR
jgi:hypothetical protein